MYIYINEKENLYPRFPGDIQLIDANWTVDKPLPEGWEQVIVAPFPVTAIDEIAEELPPIKKDGVWHQVFAVRKLTEEELDNLLLFQEELAKPNESTINQA